MVFTNFGRQAVAWRLGSSLPSLYIQYVGIGTGSATVLVNNETLVTESNRVSLTGSPNFTTARKVTFQGDLNSVQMSGINLTEFGFFDTGSSTGFTGSIWLREGFGSIVFDGTNELQINATIEVLPSGTS